MDLKKWSMKWMNNKNTVINLIVIFLCGVLLILIGNLSGSFSSGSKSSNDDGTAKQNALEVGSQNYMDNMDYEEKIKTELSAILSKIDGVGKTAVMLYFSGSSKTVPAFNVNNSTSKSEEKDQTGGKRTTLEDTRNQNIVLIDENGNNKPLLLTQNYPKISGLIVVAEGAGSAAVRERILDAVKTAFNIECSKISIMPMNLNESSYK